MITWEDVLNKTVEWRSVKKLSRITTMPFRIRAELWKKLLEIEDVRSNLDKNPVTTFNFELCFLDIAQREFLFNLNDIGLIFFGD